MGQTTQDFAWSIWLINGPAAVAGGYLNAEARTHTRTKPIASKQQDAVNTCTHAQTHMDMSKKELMTQGPAPDPHEAHKGKPFSPLNLKSRPDHQSNARCERGLRAPPTLPNAQSQSHGDKHCHAVAILRLPGHQPRQDLAGGMPRKSSSILGLGHRVTL